jgi:peptide/nickel transport system substrate-binding protein
MDSYVPDQTVELSRFDDYTPRSDASDGASGEKVAIVDTITFDPTDASNALNLLRTGALDVQSQFALDQVGSVEDDPAMEAVVIPNGSFPLLQLNTKTGPMSDQTLRQALLAAIDAEQVMAAAAPSPDYYTLDSSLMPPESPWHSTEGSELYNQADPERSQELQEEAGYDGEQVTLLYQTTDAWAPAAIAQIEDAGFNLEAVPVDAATYTQRRADPEMWDMFISGGTSYGDPLTVVFMSSGFPGWWDTPEKQELMDRFLAGTTEEERKEVWDEIQALIYEQVPFIRFGGRAQVDAIASTVAEYPPFPGSARGFYNVALGAE